MSNKTNIEEAKDNLRFFNEGDYITREMSQSATLLEQYIERLEKENEEYNRQLDLDYVEENYIKRIDVDKVINEARETIAKANKYDSLVEKVKEGEIFITVVNFTRKILQDLELLDTEK